MQITEIGMKLNLEFGTWSLNFTGKEEKEGKQIYSFEKEEEPKIHGQVEVEDCKGVSKVLCRVKLEQSPMRENDTLEAKAPVVVSLKFDETPEKINAQYQHRDWWSRPEFGKDFSNVPERTQSLFAKYSDGYAHLLPMAGKKMKSYLQAGEDGRLDVMMTAYTGGIHQVEDVCLLFAKEKELSSSIESVWKRAAALTNMPLRKERSYPEMFEYFGWCSWDAFYTDINEEKVREKVRELCEKKAPVRWILLDDGWLSVRDNCLYSLEPEKEKFPQGFKKMCKEIKEKTNIDHVGVWHAFGGYWGGIEADSALAAEYKENLYATKNGKLVPHFDAQKGFGFFGKWYSYLHYQGIDFVKVDGQSAIKNYYRHNEEIGKVAKGSHQALEAAVNLYMNGNLINCMGMASENIFNRPLTGISRNSDDFVPNEEKGFREHMLQNAYNALYHSQLYYGDWDMFWTKHKDAKKHALVRAISGGPIYVSDEIGATQVEEIWPLVYKDGRILRMERSALPIMDCIFDSPLEDKNLVLTNVVKGTGAMTFFHISEKEQAITSNVCAADIQDLEGEEFLVYHAFSGKTEWVKKDTKIAVTLEKDGYDLLLFLPKGEVVTPIGLTDKYMSAHALMEQKYADRRTYIRVVEGGKFAFVSEKEVIKVYVNGDEYTEHLSLEKGVYLLDLENQGENLTIAICY